MIKLPKNRVRIAAFHQSVRDVLLKNIGGAEAHFNTNSGVMGKRLAAFKIIYCPAFLREREFRRHSLLSDPGCR